MATDLIRYDVLVQQALRSVVRKVLTDGAKEGLPGAHHFYISFNTSAPGVKISPRIKDMYPEEMTIVLQHQYWDLVVNEVGFEVSLSFDKIAERLIIPFEGITGFFDPSVKFGLKFEAAEQAPENDDVAAKPVKAKKAPAKAKPAEQAQEPTPIGKKPAKPAVQTAAPVTAEAAEKPAAAAVKSEAKAEPSAEVVSLDAFRKKK